MNFQIDQKIIENAHRVLEDSFITCGKKVDKILEIRLFVLIRGCVDFITNVAFILQFPAKCHLDLIYGVKKQFQEARLDHGVMLNNLAFFR